MPFLRKNWRSARSVHQCMQLIAEWDETPPQREHWRRRKRARSWWTMQHAVYWIRRQHVMSRCALKLLLHVLKKMSNAKIMRHHVEILRKQVTYCSIFFFKINLEYWNNQKCIVLLIWEKEADLIGCNSAVKFSRPCAMRFTKYESKKKKEKQKEMALPRRMSECIMDHCSCVLDRAIYTIVVTRPLHGSAWELLISFAWL